MARIKSTDLLRLIRITTLVSLSLICLIAGYNRNAIWHDEISLWENVITKSPNKIRPNNELATAYSFKASVYSSSKLTTQAIKYFHIALSLNPDDTKIHNNLGMLYDIMGQYEAAIKHYKYAIMLSPRSYRSYNNLGQVYWKMGMQKAAIENYMKAISLKPDYADSHFNLGLIYIDMKNFADARKELETVLAINPTDVDANS